MSKDKNLETDPASPVGMRLNKYVAHCGICSRRKADEFIQQGFVKVNDQVVKEPGHRVLDGDSVSFKGEVITPVEEKVYLLLNKPKNTITTVSDDRGRRTVMDIVAKATDVRIFPVGRLDRETTGLLLITNDGDLAKKLSHPSHKVVKVYHVTLDKPVTEIHLEQIRQGLNLTDGLAPVLSANFKTNADKNEVVIEIHIGRNRIVRRLFEHLGYNVVKLDRTYYAGLTKKNISRGRFRHLSEKEVIMLKHFT